MDTRYAEVKITEEKIPSSPDSLRYHVNVNGVDCGAIRMDNVGRNQVVYREWFANMVEAAIAAAF